MRPCTRRAKPPRARPLNVCFASSACPSASVPTTASPSLPMPWAVFPGSAWWIRLGIQPELIEPARPQQNGAHERMHRTLKAETTRPPERSLKAQQRRFDAFRSIYNDERPHEALDLQPPASLFQPSARPFPDRLRPSSIRPTTRSVSSAPTAASAGANGGSTSAPCSENNTSDSRRSTTGSGLCAIPLSNSAASMSGPSRLPTP